MAGLSARRAFSGLAGLALGAIAAGVPAAGAMELLTHRAVYDLALGEQPDGAGIAGLRGRMVYEITGGPCEGYSVAFRFVTQVSDESGAVRVTDLQTSSYEEASGKTFQFLSKTYVNRDGRIALALKKPEKRDTAINGKALFPTEHLRRMLDAAEQGETIFIADIFDGSDTGDKVYETTAVIGQRRDGPGAPERDDAKAVDAIGTADHWPVTISYFDEKSDETGERTPVYQLSFLLYENGVSRRLTLDYGDFTLKGNLSEFTRLEPVACGG
jgi:hypothetical protein